MTAELYWDGLTDLCHRLTAQGGQEELSFDNALIAAVSLFLSFEQNPATAHIADNPERASRLATKLVKNHISTAGIDLVQHYLQCAMPLVSARISRSPAIENQALFRWTEDLVFNIRQMAEKQASDAADYVFDSIALAQIVGFVLRYSGNFTNAVSLKECFGLLEHVRSVRYRQGYSRSTYPLIMVGLSCALVEYDGGQLPNESQCKKIDNFYKAFRKLWQVRGHTAESVIQITLPALASAVAKGGADVLELPGIVPAMHDILLQTEKECSQLVIPHHLSMSLFGRLLEVTGFTFANKNENQPDMRNIGLACEHFMHSHHKCHCSREVFFDAMGDIFAFHVQRNNGKLPEFPRPMSLSDVFVTHDEDNGEDIQESAFDGPYGDASKSRAVEAFLHDDNARIMTSGKQAGQMDVIDNRALLAGYHSYMRKLQNKINSQGGDDTTSS